jgi:iron complex outermembrane receptor protein
MLTAQYNQLLSKSKQLSLVIRGEWKYIGRQYFDLANSIKGSPYHLLNTRAGITAKKWELMFWGRNLGDKRYISYAYDFGAVHLGDPLTYGANLNVRF